MHRHRAMVFESLEQRAMLTVTWGFSNGTLTITGDTANNTIQIYHQILIPTAPTGTDYVRVKVNGTDLPIANINTYGVTSINFNGGTGSETLDTTAVLPADYGYLTSITINGGNGNDTIITGPTTSSCTMSLNGANGADNYIVDQSIAQGAFSIADSGTSGFDTASIGTTGTTGETVTITNNHVSRSSGGTLTYSGLDQIEVDTSVANDTVNINSTIGQNTLVTTGNGVDTINVNSTASGAWLYIDGCASGDTYNIVGSAVLGAVSLPDSGTSGNDNVVISSTRTTAETVGITSTQVTRNSAGTITYSNLESLEVDTGSGNDSVTVSSTSAGATWVETGSGTDTIAVTGTASGTSLYLDGGASGDTYTITQSGAAGNIYLGDTGASGFDMATVGTVSTSGETVDITSTQVTRSGDGTVNYTGLEQIEVDTSIAADNVTVDSTIGGNTLVTTGNGSDTLTVNSTASGSWLYIDGCADGDNYTFIHSAVLGAVTLPDSGSSGTDTVTIDSAAASAETVGLGATTITRAGAGTITYSGVEALTVDTNNSGDTVNVTGSGATTTQLNTRDGDDTIYIPSWSGPANSLSVDGGNGNDTIDRTGNSNPGGVLATVSNVETII